MPLLSLSLIILAEIFVMYILSKNFARETVAFLYSLTSSKKVSLYIYSILLLPGTFIHEAAHFLAALFLLVPVGKFNLVPKIEEDGGIRMGSVSIAETDQLRRTLVGVAPFIIGMTLIFTIVSYYLQNNLLTESLYIILFIFILFEIGNTLFMSRKDLEGTWKLIVLILILYAAYRLLNISLTIPEIPTSLLSKIIEMEKTLAFYLLFPIGIDVGAIIIFKTLNKIRNTSLPR